jgi:hypothetical protein
VGLILGFIAGPLGKVAGIAALLAGLIAGGVWVVREHDARVLAEALAAEQAVQIAAIQADHVREVAALQAAAADAQAHAARTIAIRSSIDATPHTMGCANSPAIGAAVDGLRRHSVASGAGAAPGRVAGPAGLPGPAGATRPAS